MDPNETLAQIRALTKRILDSTGFGDDRTPHGDVELDAIELATLAQALDEWLTRGGFLPRAWRNPTTLEVHG